MSVEEVRRAGVLARNAGRPFESEEAAGVAGESAGAGARAVRARIHLKVNPETLRLLMLVAGLWSRARKRKPYRSRRERVIGNDWVVRYEGRFLQLPRSLRGHFYFGNRGDISSLV